MCKPHPNTRRSLRTREGVQGRLRYPRVPASTGYTQCSVSTDAPLHHAHTHSLALVPVYHLARLPAQGHTRCLAIRALQASPVRA